MPGKIRTHFPAPGASVSMTPIPSSAVAESSDLAALYIADTVRWLERAVIGLNLCPFAKGVHVKGQIHYAVSWARGPADVLHMLRGELADLVAVPAQTRDTTLLLLPSCLQDFLDFNDFLAEAEILLEEMELDGIVQIASFHPQFQFAGTDLDDVTNCTNRAPYPTLHLLREESIDRAVEVFPDAEAIFERNMETLEALGTDGWIALDVGASVPAAQASSLLKDANQ